MLTCPSFSKQHANKVLIGGKALDSSFNIDKI